MQKRFHKKAFTLIEMLIVIVIIGVLASALIPRFNSIRDRTNDLSRKADLNQIAGAVIARQMDHNGNLPGGIGYNMDVSDISLELKSAGLDGIPQDPKSVTQVSGLGTGLANSTGQYSYMRIMKNGITDASFVLMAKIETPGAANRVYDPSINRSLIEPTVDSSYILPCKSVSKGITGVLNYGGDCYYSSLDQLRFIIIR